MVERSSIQGVLVLAIMATSIVFAQGGLSYSAGFLTEGYESTTAIVIDKTIDVIDGGEDGIDKYRPVIQYRYTISGIEYTNDDYTATDDAYSFRGNAQEILDQYEIGSEITIYYDKDYPHNSVILKGVQESSVNEVRIGLMFSAAITLLLVLVSIPDMRNIYKKYETVQTAKEGKIIKFSSKDLSLANDIDPGKFKYFRNSLELTTPFRERINQIFDDTRYALTGFTLFVLFTIHEVVFLLTFSGEFPEGIIILVIGALVLLKYLLKQTESLIGKIVTFIALPFAYLFAYGIGLVVLLVIPLLIIAIIFIGGIVFVIPFSVSTFILGYQLSFIQLAIMFAISTVVGLVLYSILQYHISMLNLQYDNLGTGHKYYDYAYSNGRIELYAMDGDDKLYVGSKTGEVLIVDANFDYIPKHVKIHDGAVIDLQLQSDLLVTLSIDLTLKISKLSNSGIDPQDSYELESIARTLYVDSRYIFVGQDDGRVLQFAYANEQLELIHKLQVFKGGITCISGDDQFLYIGSRDKFTKIFDKSDFQEINQVKIHKDIISDIYVDEFQVITTSLDGALSITKLDNIKDHKLIKLPDKDDDKDGITALTVFNEILLIGTTKGYLYRIDPREYDPDFHNLPEFKDIKGIEGFKIHNQWIEDIMIRGKYLFTVSSDGTMKTLHMKFDLSLTESIDKETQLKGMSSDNKGKEIEKTKIKQKEFCSICGSTVKPLIACPSCELNYHLKHFSDQGIQAECPNCHAVLEG